MHCFEPVLVAQPGWTIPTHPYPEAHFATYPPELIEPCILAGCPPGGTVLDPFGGSGTTAEVADRLGCDAILIELNPRYIELQKRPTAQPCLFSAMEQQAQAEVQRERNGQAAEH